MLIEDIKSPCEDCVHESVCTIRHPEVAKELPEEERILRCEKLNKFSRHVEITRVNI